MSINGISIKKSFYCILIISEDSLQRIFELLILYAWTRPKIQESSSISIVNQSDRITAAIYCNGNLARPNTLPNLTLKLAR